MVTYRCVPQLTVEHSVTVGDCALIWARSAAAACSRIPPLTFSPRHTPIARVSSWTGMDDREPGQSYSALVKWSQAPSVRSVHRDRGPRPPRARPAERRGSRRRSRPLARRGDRPRPQTRRADRCLHLGDHESRVQPHLPPGDLRFRPSRWSRRLSGAGDEPRSVGAGRVTAAVERAAVRRRNG